jgi:predicted glycoside hydrolase/deacetylase ChbG (UPF0249 family)
VNDGIVEAHRSGILTSTTLMANGEAFEHAVQLARSNPTLDVGCHLTLIGGEALTGGTLPSGVPELLGALARGKLPIYEELAAQVHKIQAAGIRPTHLDTHKHTHLAPPVLRAVARIAHEFDIRWIRRPFDFSPGVNTGWAPKALRLAIGLQRMPFARVLDGLRTTDHFVGFALTGHIGVEEMEQAIRRLPDGFTEFMCHPGYCRGELMAAPTRLKQSRERELEALTSPRVRRAVEDRKILLAGFSSA